MTEGLSKLKIAPEQRAKKDLKGRQKKKSLVFGLAALAIAVLIIYRYKYYAVPVTVRPLEVHELGLPPVLLTAGGYIVADPQVTVSSKIPGQIVRLPVAEGDSVKAGDSLAVIAAEDLSAQTDSARRASQIAGDNYRRMQALYGAGAVSHRELDQAEVELKAAEAQFKSAEFNYGLSRIMAPIDGTVIRILRKEGEYLSPGLSADGEPGTSILTLGNLTRMQVELDINEGDIGKLKIDQPALVFPDAYPNLTVNGRVSNISPMANRQKSIVPVKVRLENETGVNALKPEMSARVIFLEKEMKGAIDRSLLLPENAIRRVRGKPYVFVLENDHAIRRPVELGERVENAWKVKSGLTPGTAVVIDPPFILRDGRRVSVKSE